MKKTPDPSTVSREESYAYCTALARAQARNFYFSFLSLPTEMFRAMCVLYAFMRLSDDLGDDAGVPLARRSAQLAAWRTSLEHALERSDYNHHVFPALADVVRRYDIPAAHLYSVVEGVGMDLEKLRFDTFDELADYCYHVAGCVGLCCIHIWGFHDSRALECAVDCGLAFQLTNILRDLSEDAAMTRVYLPQEDLRRFGYSAEELCRHVRNDNFVQLMQFEVDRAKTYYQRAERLFEYLAPPGKPVLDAMLRIYRGLLDEIERRDYDVFESHVTLPTWRKLLIAADSLFRRRFLPNSDFPRMQGRGE